MIGIYKIVNKINKKIYIGKSINIEKRWKEHIRHSKEGHQSHNIPLHKAIIKYGKENFIFEVIQECDTDILNDLEKFYIKKYNSNNKKIGYNVTNGGDGGPIMYGSKNPNSVLPEEVVIYIRQCYEKGIYKMDVYNEMLEKHNLNYNTFCCIWRGNTYKKIMPEVFTEERRKYHRDLAFKNRTPKHVEKVKKYVLEIRERRIKGDFWKNVHNEYSFINENTFKDIWYNRTFKYMIPNKCNDYS
jgi:group I intron endonuclease